MKRYAAVAVFAALFVWAGAGQAQEAYTIKLRTRAEGDVVVVTKNEVVTSKIKVENDGNVIVDQNEKKGEISHYTETILKRDAKKPPTKLERAYAKCQTSKDGDAEDLEMQGKTVVIEKVGAAYRSTYKNGDEVTGKSAKLLSTELGRKGESNAELEKLMLPKNAVKAGETWKLDMEPIFKELFKGAKDGEMVLDVAKATGTGKLIKAYKKGGRQFGEMHYNLTVPLKSMGKGQGMMKFNDGAKLTLDMTLDTCIDGTSETGTVGVKMYLGGTATLPLVPGAIATLEVRSVTTGTQGEPAKK